MGSRDGLQPHAPWAIRHLVAAQLFAHALPGLPVGYWQRRIAARAFALDVVPAVPRESQVVSVARMPGVPPIWVLASDVMTWGVVPWVWRAEARSERAQARGAVARVRTAARTPHCAVVFVTSTDETRRTAHMPRLRLTGAASAVTAVGLITLGEIAEVLEEAARDLVDREGHQIAVEAAHRVRMLVGGDDGRVAAGQDAGLRSWGPAPVDSSGAADNPQ